MKKTVFDDFFPIFAFHLERVNYVNNNISDTIQCNSYTSMITSTGKYLIIFVSKDNY